MTTIRRWYSFVLIALILTVEYDLACEMHQHTMFIFTYPIEDIMEVFKEDIFVYKNNFYVYLSNLCRMFQRCEKKHFLLNRRKCTFTVRDRIVLRHQTSKNDWGEQDKNQGYENSMTNEFYYSRRILLKRFRGFLGHGFFHQGFL